MDQFGSKLNENKPKVFGFRFGEIYAWANRAGALSVKPGVKPGVDVHPGQPSEKLRVMSSL